MRCNPVMQLALKHVESLLDLNGSWQPWRRILLAMYDLPRLMRLLFVRPEVTVRQAMELRCSLAI